MKWLAVIYILICSTSTYSQEAVNFGFGADVGYKSRTNEVGIMASLRIKQFLSTYVSLGYGKHSGFGYSVGVNGYFLKAKCQLAAGVNFNHQGGNKFSVGESSSGTNYYVPKHSSLVYSLGVRWTIPFDDASYNRFITFSPYVSYRDIISTIELIRESGSPKLDIETKVLNRIGDGIGGGVSLIYYFGTKKNSSGSKA